MPMAANSAGAVAGHGFQDAHARHDQFVDRRFVFERALFAVGGDGAVNQPGVESGESVGLHQRLPIGRRREVFENYVGRANQVFIGRCDL